MDWSPDGKRWATPPVRHESDPAPAGTQGREPLHRALRRKKAMKQKINSDVEGGVAGRDIVRNESHHTTVIQRHEAKPESQLQSEFAKTTGIWCPRSARETFEWLMENHGFTAPELCVAWKASSLSTDADRQQIKIVTPWIEAVFGWTMLILISLFFLMLAIPLIFSNDRHNWSVLGTLTITGLVYLGMVWIVSQTSLKPRRIAIRVRKKLDGGRVPDDTTFKQRDEK